MSPSYSPYIYLSLSLFLSVSPSPFPLPLSLPLPTLSPFPLSLSLSLPYFLTLLSSPIMGPLTTSQTYISRYRLCIVAVGGVALSPAGSVLLGTSPACYHVTSRHPPVSCSAAPVVPPESEKGSHCSHGLENI